MCYLSNLLKIIKQILLLLFFLGSGTKVAFSADQVVLKYGIGQESIPVKDLRMLVDSGEASSKLQGYLQLANRQPKDLQKVLNQPLTVDPILLSKFLHSFLGELFLDEVSQVIHTPQIKASRESLRGALVTSALTDGKISLIKILELYPTPWVEVEGDRLVELSGFLQKTLRR